MTFLSLADSCRHLGIDPKTLRRWLLQAHLPVQRHPTDGRKTGLSEDHLRQLACLHHRSLPALPEQEHPLPALGAPHPAPHCSPCLSSWLPCKPSSPLSNSSWPTSSTWCRSSLTHQPSRLRRSPRLQQPSGHPHRHPRPPARLLPSLPSPRRPKSQRMSFRWSRRATMASMWWSVPSRGCLP